MNERIKRLKEEYEKTESKIVFLQEKSKKLAEKIRTIEDRDIVEAVRTSGMNIDEILELLGKSESAEKSESSIGSSKNIKTKNDLEESKNEV